MSKKVHALDLISQYSSGESVCEEDSSEFQEVSATLPVPEAVSKLFSKDINDSSYKDDPKLHGGRVRSFPHVRGNWSTFVYVPYEYNEGLRSILSDAIEICGTEIDLKPIEKPHISLTRTVVLQHHWIDTLVEDIKKSISKVNRFIVSFSSVGVYCNDDRRRTFLSLQLSGGKTQLAECVELLNSCLSAFKLPPFYEDASFHLSIAWCLGDKSREINSKLEELNLKLQNLIAEEPDHFETVVDKAECKTGNKLFRFSLC
ncbi:unnamed protein product [Bemisia tabaci]|uniref:U6 snRNA phosphodiesterase n=1 Tax=Bemisia tabaci TaxID=7038 RepID=A0A9P0AFG8_BEMTA|nr:unnamed protein product [Bemisia tabaci]